jgi:hypothetical protein
MARRENFSVNNLVVGTINGMLPAGGIGVGNVYIVCSKSDTAVYNDLNTRFSGLSYPSGNKVFYPATALTADVAIQEALDACVSNRNDYVVVWPSDSNYSITNTLTMSKKAVHLICPAGLGVDFPVGNTARLKAITAAMNVIAISNQAVEVAGFYIKNYTALAAITLSAAAHAPNIHHNAFMMVWSGTPAAIITGAGAGGAWGSIQNNWFISETGTSITAAVAAIAIQAAATGCRVCKNEVTIGDNNTATIGISNAAIKGHTDFNVFSDCYSSGAQPKGTFGACIQIGEAACAIGNRGAVATTTLLAGGTANKSFCDNKDAQAGGAVEVES